MNEILYEVNLIGEFKRWKGRGGLKNKYIRGFFLEWIDHIPCGASPHPLIYTRQRYLSCSKQNRKQADRNYGMYYLGSVLKTAPKSLSVIVCTEYTYTGCN